MGLWSTLAEKLFGGIAVMVRARKDLTQTEESKLKIEQLEDEKRERESIIQPATLEDVEKYDEKHKQLQRALGTRRVTVEDELRNSPNGRCVRPRGRWRMATICLLLVIVGVALILIMGWCR